MEEYENGFPDMGWFMDWGTRAWQRDFKHEADSLIIPCIIFSEVDHPGGGPYFESAAKKRWIQTKTSTLSQVGATSLAGTV
jgi:hypothetical protein